MNQRLVIEDLVIIIAAKNHSSLILNPDFLKCSGIIPKDWKLARQPISNNSFARLDFSNGIAISAESNRVVFIEPIADKKIESLQIAEIARKYTQALPNMEFEAVGINFRGYVPFVGSHDAARTYINKTLLSPGAWQEEGEASVQASLNLVYKLNRTSFNLSVNEGTWLQDDETKTPIVMFTGSFSYEVSGETEAQKLSSLHQSLENWQTDLQTYSDIISNKFMAKMQFDTVRIPDTVAISDIFPMSVTP
ncbi:hypothetical protein F7734_21005 [Scytonema sp. UIC 10036]|uniref:hypothetical protein n=1 Tax=Scytonema sp. UIC 10036 TaxID=2304196 RepID=UPI0012DADF41|nr:hypothetical protein [Scytonema sp. UIC 10036]MUG94707.1 hypothetical protein [Scytonema sp. UIC 10036]